MIVKINKMHHSTNTNNCLNYFGTEQLGFYLAGLIEDGGNI